MKDIMKFSAIYAVTATVVMAAGVVLNEVLKGDDDDIVEQETDLEEDQ